MSETAITLVGNVDKLASMPDIALRIDDLLADENSSAWDIGRLIEGDPSLSAALLRMANSALYSNGVEITAIDRAVTLVGGQRVRDLAYGVVAVSAFHGIPEDLISMPTFWSQSLRVGATAHAIADHVGSRFKDAMFIAGLLHGIGKLVMYGLRPAESRQVLENIQQTPDSDPITVERSVFGFDHAEVGAALAEKWQLPMALADAIAYHIEPSRSSGSDNAAWITCLASQLASAADGEPEQLIDAIDAEVLSHLGIAGDELATICRQADQTFAELKTIFVKH